MENKENRFAKTSSEAIKNLCLQSSAGKYKKKQKQTNTKHAANVFEGFVTGN